MRRGTGTRLLNWSAARARLAEMTTVTPGTLTDEQARALMEERARLLSRRPERVESDHGTIEVLAFALGSERYGIEMRFVREVVRLRDVCPVPGAPGYVLGVMNHRGQILSVVDLRTMLRAAPAGVTDLSRVIVIALPDGELALLADRVEDIKRLPPRDILSPGEGLLQDGRELVRGVTTDALIVLDGATLFRGDRLIVDQRDPHGPAAAAE